MVARSKGSILKFPILAQSPHFTYKSQAPAGYKLNVKFHKGRGVGTVMCLGQLEDNLVTSIVKYGRMTRDKEMG